MATPSDYLKKLMVERFVGVKDLIRITKISRPTVSRHVNGRFQPDLESREKYAAVFGMTLKEFEAGWQQMVPTAISINFAADALLMLQQIAEEMDVTAPEAVELLVRDGFGRRKTTRNSEDVLRVGGLVIGGMNADMESGMAMRGPSPAGQAPPPSDRNSSRIPKEVGDDRRMKEHLDEQPAPQDESLRQDVRRKSKRKS